MAPHITRELYEAQLRQRPESATALDRGWYTIHRCACDYEGCEGWRVATDLRRMLLDNGIPPESPMLALVDEIQVRLGRT